MQDGRRRQVLIATCALIAAPRAACAQQATNPYRVALIFTTTKVADMANSEPQHPGRAGHSWETLRASGYVESRNLIYEPRSAEGKYDRYAEIFTELVPSEVGRYRDRR